MSDHLKRMATVKAAINRCADLRLDQVGYLAEEVLEALRPELEDARLYNNLKAAMVGGCTASLAVTCNIGHDWITVEPDHLGRAIQDAARQEG